jgi:hypothetical protein
MKTILRNIILFLVLFCAVYACQNNTHQETKPENVFKATGNTDSDHRAEPQNKGEVVVTFDLLPTKMSFNLPSFPCMVTENDIYYYNGWPETYDRKIGGDIWFEPLMDTPNRYSRMWIESQNDARVIVRWRGALCNRGDLNIAHSDVPSGSPYGEGDWFDEWYIIYPDGIHVRKSKIYTYYASVSKPLSWELYCHFEEPSSDYVHEFQEMLLLGKPGRLPEDDLEIKALTLIHMNGEFSKISYDPYPIKYKPAGDELFTAFGKFAEANIFVVNTKSKYRPFTIARKAGVNISPYPPERESRSGIFQSWPQESNRKEGYGGAGLGHIINRQHYEKTDNSLTQIYLSGWTSSSNPEQEIVPLARSWLSAPKLKFISNDQAPDYRFDPAQRAYLLDYNRLKKEIEFEIAANDSSLIYNPAFLINNWGRKHVELKINGSLIELGMDYRIGYYNYLDIYDESQWRDVLLVWMQMKSSKPVRIKIRRLD